MSEETFASQLYDKLMLFVFDNIYVAEKVHCVWLSNGEAQILFECKGVSNPENFLSVHIDCISNKSLVQEYLDQMQFIPHSKRTVTMESTIGLIKAEVRGTVITMSS